MTNILAFMEQAAGVSGDEETLTTAILLLMQRSRAVGIPAIQVERHLSPFAHLAPFAAVKLLPHIEHVEYREEMARALANWLQLRFAAAEHADLDAWGVANPGDRKFIDDLLNDRADYTVLCKPPNMDKRKRLSWLRVVVPKLARLLLHQDALPATTPHPRRHFEIRVRPLFGEITNPDATTSKPTSLLSISSDIAEFESEVTTAFWEGRYSLSAVQSQALLENAVHNQNFDLAALALANLLLISRSRQRFHIFEQLVRRHLPNLPLRQVSPEYRYRLMKEFFVFYYERENFDRAGIYLNRMERIDPDLSMFTPADDWMPGTIRWRKAHLLRLTDPGRKNLATSIAIAREGVEYLESLIPGNPNTAGLASGHMNLGWLYLLDGNPISLDFFELASSEANGYSVRTELESKIAAQIGELRFGGSYSAGIAADLTTALRSHGHAFRSYAFLRRDDRWPSYRELLKA